MRILILPVVALCGLVPGCQGSRGEQPDLARSLGWIVRGGDQGPCQAVVVGPEQVLTAAHCVAETAGWRPPARGEVQFVTGGRALEVLEVEMSSSPALASSGAIVDLQQDWAVLRVAVQEAFPAPLSLGGRRAAWRAYVFEQPVVKAGLVRAPAGEAAVALESGCRVRALNSQRHLVAYGCDGGMGPGLSGSPLLIEIEGGYELIGVMTARERLLSGEEVGIVVVPPEDALPAPDS